MQPPLLVPARGTSFSTGQTAPSSACILSVTAACVPRNRGWGLCPSCSSCLASPWVSVLVLLLLLTGSRVPRGATGLLSPWLCGCCAQWAGAAAGCERWQRTPAAAEPKWPLLPWGGQGRCSVSPTSSSHGDASRARSHAPCPCAARSAGIALRLPGCWAAAQLGRRAEGQRCRGFVPRAALVTRLCPVDIGHCFPC